MRRRLLRVLLVVLVLGIAGEAVAGSGEAAPARMPGSAPASVPLRELGVTTPALTANSWRRWRPADLREVDAFERDAHRRADVVVWYSDWEHVHDFDAAQAAAVAARGALPVIVWEPWDGTRGARQPRYRLRTIIDGGHDRYIRRWAREIARYGGPLRIRFAHEMNGHWYPWAERANDNRPGEYVRAWRHVRAIFRRAGATNVQWEWSPVSKDVSRRFFPGEREVDLVGLVGFNGGTRLFDHRWESFAEDFGHWIHYLHRLAPHRPVTISEVGSAEEGGNKARWIASMFAYLRRLPYVRGITWFNIRKETDWTIRSSRGARRAFARAVADG